MKMSEEKSRIMDRNLALEVVRVTEAAALPSSRGMGRGDEKAADQPAVGRQIRRGAGICFWPPGPGAAERDSVAAIPRTSSLKPEAA